MAAEAEAERVMAATATKNGHATREQAEYAARALVAGVVKDDIFSTTPALKLPIDAYADDQQRRVMKAAHELDAAGKKIDHIALIGMVGLDTVEAFLEVPISKSAARDAEIVREYYERQSFEQRIANLRNVDPDELRDAIADILPSVEEKRAPVDVKQWRTAAPRRSFIFAGTIVYASLCALVAAGGSGKSWFTLILAVSLACGRSLLAEWRPTSAARVLWIESEDDPDELHRRFRALVEFYELTDEEIALVEQNLIIFAAEAVPFINAEGNTTKGYTWLRNVIRSTHPHLIIIDPFAHYFSGDENANPAVAAWCNALLDAARLSENRPAIIVAHHTSKAAQAVSDSASARGASSFRDAARIVVNLTPLKEDEITKCGIVDPSRFVKCEITKSNYAAKPPKPSIFQRGEGGVLYDFDAETAAKEISAATVDQVVEALVRELGPNQQDLSRRDIVSQPAGKWLRDLVKDACPGATRKAFELALDAAEKQGLIEMETIGTDGARRVVPRQRAATRNCGLRDE